MADIFLSYSSHDRTRVKPVRDALAERGFSVFWDMEVPANVDWDSWIRSRLNESRCAVVVWSTNSIASDNVRHEAFIAKQQNKFVAIMLDALTADQLPMGFYAIQAANLSNWAGAVNDGEWLKLLNELEGKLTPSWMKQTLDALDAELVGERARREAAERRDRSLRDQIGKEAEARQNLRLELDAALQRIEELDAALTLRQQERAAVDVRVSEIAAELSGRDARQQALEQETTEAKHTIDTLRARVGELEAMAAERARPREHPTAPAARAATATPPSPPSGTLSIAEPRPSPRRVAEEASTSFDERWAEWQSKQNEPGVRLWMIAAIAAAVVGALMVLAK